MHTARTTAGQTLTISYDAVTNTVLFREHDWFADPVRSGVMPGTTPAVRRAAPLVVLLKRRRPVARKASRAA
jgi:hypothetical protein